MFNVNHILATGGLIVLAGIIFAESGMMVGFFLPGDTLLFSAGIFAAQGKLPIAATVAVVALAAIVGDNTGYHIGRFAGPRLFRKKDSIVFKHEYLQQAESFYERYGAKAMMFAHFVPVIRAFAPIVAGIGHMNRLKFFIFDAIGDIAWALLVTLLGYFLGSRIPHVERYVEPVMILVVLAAFAPTLYHLFRDPKFRQLLRRRK